MQIDSVIGGNSRIYLDWQQEALLPKDVRQSLKSPNQSSDFGKLSDWSSASSVDINLLLTGRQISSDSSEKMKNQLYSHPYSMKRLGESSRLVGHRGCVNSLSWDRSGRYLVSGSDDLRLMIWEPFNPTFHVDHVKLQKNQLPAIKPLFAIPTSHEANIFDAKFMCPSIDCDTLSGKLISCAADGTVLYTDLNLATDTASFRPNSPFRCHADMTTYVEPDPLGQGQVFFSCSNDGTINQYDLRIRSSCHCNHCNRHTLIDVNTAPMKFSGKKSHYVFKSKSSEGIMGKKPNPDIMIMYAGLMGAYGWGVASMSINPLNPLQIAIGMTNGVVRIYDRRFLHAPVFDSMESSEKVYPPSMTSYEGVVYEYHSANHRSTYLSLPRKRDNEKVFSEKVRKINAELEQDMVPVHANDESYVPYGQELDIPISEKQASKSLSRKFFFALKQDRVDDTDEESSDDETQEPESEIVETPKNESDTSMDEVSSDYESDDEDCNCKNCKSFNDRLMKEVPRATAEKKITSICYDPCGTDELLVNYTGFEIIRLRPSKLRNCKWNGLNAGYSPRAVHARPTGSRLEMIDARYQRGDITETTPAILLPHFDEKYRYQYDEDKIQVYLGHQNIETMLKEARFFCDGTGNSSYIVAGSDNGRVYLWRKEDLFCKYTLPVDKFFGDSMIVNCVAPNPIMPVIIASGIDSAPVMISPTNTLRSYEKSDGMPSFSQEKAKLARMDVNRSRRAIFSEFSKRHELLFDKINKQYAKVTKIPYEAVYNETSEFMRHAFMDSINEAIASGELPAPVAAVYQQQFQSSLDSLLPRTEPAQTRTSSSQATPNVPRPAQPRPRSQQQHQRPSTSSTSTNEMFRNIVL